MRNGIFIIAMMAGLIVQSATAQTTTIPGHSQSGQMQVMPVRGVNMDSVLAEFGEPIERYAAVGEPPISEWVYGSFRVYFEYEIVLHSIDMNTLIMPK